jgi:hypothetical protein
MVRYPGESRHPHLALTQLQRLLIKGRTRRAATLITRLRCVYGRTALAPFFSTAEDRSPVVDGTGKIHYPTPPPCPHPSRTPYRGFDWPFGLPAHTIPIRNCNHVSAFPFARIFTVLRHLRTDSGQTKEEDISPSFSHDRCLLALEG